MIQTPPPPTPADIRRIKALTRAVATDVRRHGTPALDQKGMAWMEDHPQCLWPLFDTAVAASTADQHDEALTVACRWLLANQLELIRYRLERGHDWARSILDAYQEKLIALTQTSTMPRADWFELVKLLKLAKVPISPETAMALLPL